MFGDDDLAHFDRLSAALCDNIPVKDGLPYYEVTTSGCGVVRRADGVTMAEISYGGPNYGDAVSYAGPAVHRLVTELRRAYEENRRAGEEIVRLKKDIVQVVGL